MSLGASGEGEQPRLDHPTPGSHGPAGTNLIPPLVLLQLSDLHFGPHSRFAGCEPPRLARQCVAALDEARRDLGWQEAIGLVIVTGDIAEAARPPEYAIAASFFRALAQELALSPHRFVFVPGNHDVSWTRCREVVGQLEDGAFPASELRGRLDDVKLAHYEKFIREVHGDRARHEVDGASVASLGHGAFVHDFPDLGVSVAALNSCERESHRAEDHVGEVSAAQAQAVLDHWRGSPAEVIRLVAVHHNPDRMASAAIEQWLGFLRASAAQLSVDLVDRIASNFTGFDNTECLRHLTADAHVALLLHGHHHASTSGQSWTWRGRDPGGAGDTRIVSAGSWGLSPESGKLPKDQPVVMQLVRLDPQAAELRAVLLTYDPLARLPGDVRTGRFLLDTRTRADRPIGLSLPPRLRGQPGSTAQRGRSGMELAGRRPAPDLAAAMARYRQRKASSFERWDLRTAGPLPTKDNRPIEITLEQMYIPLRFAAELDPEQRETGAPIAPADLLRPRPRQVLVGAAGTGKTTWMRWTFRQLIRESRAAPFFLELRSIAAAWRGPHDAGRTIESYLIDELATCGGIADPTATLDALLAEDSGIQPVILIDGWDELGAQAERLREQLVGFCDACPQVVVIVSSRPYGATRPAGAERFETRYIQPLSDADVRLLTTRFQDRVHGLDGASAARATEDFMAAVAAAPDARSLVSTALLLTMMLLLSHDRPLPDRRHKLYAASLQNMLLHRVEQRERDGVAVDVLQQWRPPDSGQRLRAVAELAYRMQTDGYKEQKRTPIVRPWDEAVDLIKKTDTSSKQQWTRDDCDRFLRWLVASAGILADRSDGSVHFAHLSFQEYLTAHYLSASREGKGRIAAVREYMRDERWWETLRLWAAITADEWPDRLSPVLAMLCADPDGYWLAGTMFADGTGQMAEFERWAADLPARLSDPFRSDLGAACAWAWGACKQSERRATLVARLASARPRLRWLDAAWHLDWCTKAHLDAPPAPALASLDVTVDSARAVARSRTLFGVAVGWPDAGELAVLRLWRSTRAVIGVRLQAAISLGAQIHEVAAMLPVLLAQLTRAWHVEDLAIIKNFVLDLARWDRLWDQFFNSNFSRDFLPYIARDLVRYSCWDCGGYLMRNFDRDFTQDLDKELPRNFAQLLPGRFSRHRDPGPPQAYAVQGTLHGITRKSDHWTYALRDLYWDFAIVRDLEGSSVSTAAWLPMMAVLEAGSATGRAAPRASLAHGEIPAGIPLLGLFRLACQASFAPQDAGLALAVSDACGRFDGDPLWPALARHVARISTSEDVVLLEQLAGHPEQREPPLSWGLQHYVRGDLVLDDDSVVTLDELCAQVGLPPLPLVEPMPDELVIKLETPPDLLP